MNSYIAIALAGALSACTPAMMGTQKPAAPCPDAADATIKRSRIQHAVLEKEPRELGRAHGVWRDFYDTGQIREVGCYHQGAQVGVWQLFYPDGQVRSVRTYGGPDTCKSDQRSDATN